MPDEVLSKEFLSQFKTEADDEKKVSEAVACPKCWKRCLKAKWMPIWVMKKNSVAGNNTGNSRNGNYPKKIQTEHGEAVISIPRVTVTVSLNR